MSDMPLPMPRSVICSPSHMMKQVPVVSVSTVISRNAEPGVVDQRQAAGDLRLPLEEDRDAERLHDAQEDRAVARVLRDLAAAELAFLRQLLEVRPDDRQQLQDDRRADVRHDAEREDRHLRQVPAREHVVEAEHRGSASAAPARRAPPMFTPGVGMWWPTRYTPSSPSVNSTRLRSSETAKMFLRLFSMTASSRLRPRRSTADRFRLRRRPPRSSPPPCR